MKNSTFSELLWLFWFSVRGCVKHEKTRFVCDIRYFAGLYVLCSTNTLGKNGKTLRRESAQGGHLFTICARFADVCMVLQNVKGLGLFCGAWQIAERGYNKRWKGDAATGGWPRCVRSLDEFQQLKETVTWQSGGFCFWVSVSVSRPNGRGYGT